MQCNTPLSFINMSSMCGTHTWALPLCKKEKCRKSDAHNNFTYIAMIDHILIHSNLVLSFPRLSITKVVNIVGTIILN